MKPLRLMPSTLIFVSAAMLMGVITHLCIPFLSEVAGLESIIFWFICGGLGVFTPLIIAGVMMLRKEGGKFTKETFVERLRFRPMTRRDWRYSLLALVVIGLLTSGIMIAMQVLFSDFNHTPSFMTLDPLSPRRYWLLHDCHIGCSISEAKSSFGEVCCYLGKKRLSKTKRGYYMALVGQFFI